ncbi:hypothetical protein CYB_0294 [Synechococcus sp. JA-2-3B'a(2-13)]|nr:hypothetical protein CYB_0294 [Synechococcus sp. JA-2-3B'a(2-13)]
MLPTQQRDPFTQAANPEGQGSLLDWLVSALERLLMQQNQS